MVFTEGEGRRYGGGTGVLGTEARPKSARVRRCRRLGCEVYALQVASPVAKFVFVPQVHEPTPRRLDLEKSGPLAEIWGRIDDLEDDVSEIQEQQTRSVPTVESDRRLAGVLSGIASTLSYIVRGLPPDEQSEFRKTVARNAKGALAQLERTESQRAVAYAEGRAGWLAAILLSMGPDADEIVVQYELEDVVTVDNIRGLLNPSYGHRVSKK